VNVAGCKATTPTFVDGKTTDDKKFPTLDADKKDNVAKVDKDSSCTDSPALSKVTFKRPLAAASADDGKWETDKEVEYKVCTGTGNWGVDADFAKACADVKMTFWKCNAECETCEGTTKDKCLSCVTADKRVHDDKAKTCACKVGTIDVAGKCEDCDATCLTCEAKADPAKCKTCDDKKFRVIDAKAKTCGCVKDATDTKGVCSFKCVASCLTCKGIAATDCVTCDDKKFRVLNAKTSACDCMKDYELKDKATECTKVVADDKKTDDKKTDDKKTDDKKDGEAGSAPVDSGTNASILAAISFLFTFLLF